MVSPSKAKVNSGDTYSLLVGCIFVFNLILGTGALAMPHVFSKAGWLMGLFIITILCFMSYIQLTFVVEALANANFDHQMSLIIEQKDAEEETKGGKTQKNDDESSNPLWYVKHSPKDRSTQKKGKNGSTSVAASTTQATSTQSDTSKLVVDLTELDLKKYFEINDKFEMGGMSEAFLLPWMSFLFFVSILAYLYGDLIVYNTMMSKSMREVACTYEYACDAVKQLYERCWHTLDWTRHDVYRLLMMLLMVVLIPLTYLGLTKTKIIQVITIILRWVASICMIGIAIHVIVVTKDSSAKPKPQLASIVGFPRMFGICVYAFMCHHSVPGMLTPIDKKQSLNIGLIVVYVLVLIVYYLITMTGIFAFDEIEDVYTLNFVMNPCGLANDTNLAKQDANIVFLNVFLPSYPVFTIFSSYTVIALTLINNLKIVLAFWVDAEQPALKYTYPLIAIVPPLVVSVFTENVALVVSLVGAYTGSLIQYVFPTLLVYYSRRAVQEKYLAPYLLRESQQQQEKGGTELPQAETATSTATTSIKSGNSSGKQREKKSTKSDKKAADQIVAQVQQLYYGSNAFASPFQHRYYVYGTAVWWVFSVIMVTVDQVIKNLPHHEK